ncbi:MAG: hypothetical protein GEU95_15105 [Rhizobiales bacterium]|nr:hypothetical protein [Hyphomicrobiales bacterium]
MKHIAITAIVCCGLGMAGCAAQYDAPAIPISHASNATHSTVAQEWRPRARRAARVRKTAQMHKARAEHANRELQADSTGTIGSAPASNLKPYSPEWWAQERAREAREDERLRRVMQICRAC